MDIVNFPAIIEKYGMLTPSEVDKFNDLILIGKKVKNLRDGSQYLDYPITIAEFAQALGIVPIAYKTYSALLFQTDQEPTVIGIGENTLGEIPIYNKQGVGSYEMQSPIFGTARLVLVTHSGSDWGFIKMTWNGGDKILISTSDNTATPSDSVLQNITVNVQVFF